jgi:hypothetical protein
LLYHVIIYKPKQKSDGKENNDSKNTEKSQNGAAAITSEDFPELYTHKIAIRSKGDTGIVKAKP